MSTNLRPTALIVDDNVFNRDICRIVLENVGYHIVEAADGGEALKFLRQNHPVQLILLDLQMPVIDGPSLLRLIPANLNIQVIIMTAYPTWVNHFITETAQHVMYKPLNIEKLKGLVQHLRGAEC